MKEQKNIVNDWPQRARTLEILIATSPEINNENVDDKKQGM